MNTIDLEKKASFLRRQILETIISAGKGHIGGALSCVDLMTVIYYGIGFVHSPTNPNHKKRDRLIFSKGHASIAQFVVLQDLGYFPENELHRLNNRGLLGEHPNHLIPGIEVASGSLGHGLGICCGFSLADKGINDNLSIVVLGDGECYEGSIWESALFAGHHQLNRLVAVVDRNGLCATGSTEEVNRLEPFSDKWRAFGWEVREINGHNIDEIKSSMLDVRTRTTKKPLAIIANTIKGKGLTFIEGKSSSHHGGISKEMIDQARSELPYERGDQ